METVPASIQDAEGIAEAHVSAWQTAYRGIVSDAFLDAMNIKERSARWRANLEDSECTILVAKDKDQINGFVSFGRHREPGASPEEGEIWTMYVHPRSWRTRIGRSLMTTALAALDSRGHRSTWVWALSANLQAISFYSSCGFKLHASSKRFFTLGEQRLEEVALVRDAA